MGLKDLLSEDLKTSLKARDELKVSSLRFLLAAIKNKQIDLRHELSDSEIQQVIQTQVKQRLDSIEQFEKGNRKDLVEKETRELEILKSYLPPPFSQDELDGLIDQAIAESKATSKDQLGLVMKILMPKVRGRVDGRIVNQRVREKLS